MKKIAYFDASDPFWEELGEAYQEMTLDEFVEHVTTEYPETKRDEEEDPADYEIENEDDRYVVCYRDGMTEAVIIYQK